MIYERRFSEVCFVFFQIIKGQILKEKNPLPIHPVIFALYPVVSLYAHNAAKAQIADVPLPLTAVLLGTLLVWLLLWLMTRDAARSALIVTLGLFIFFSYGHFYNIVKYLTIAGVRIGRHRFLPPALVLTYAAACFFILKSRAIPAWLTRFLNAAVVILILMSAFKLTVYFLTKSKSTAVPAETVSLFDTRTNAEISPRRDVYFIILDAYPNKFTLSDVYDFDNSEFIRHLRELGFAVANRAYSNYNQTMLSLPSMMRMDYVNFLQSDPGENSRDITIPSFLMHKGTVWQQFRRLGYRLVLICSGWGPNDRSDFVDDAIKTSHYNEFLMMLTHTSMLSALENRLLLVSLYRESVRSMFAELEKSGSAPGPKFVMAHFMVPHPPFIFNARGEEVPPACFSPNEWLPRSSFVEQLQFVNSRLLNALERILAESKVKPVIVIIGDHGPASIHQWRHPSDDFLRERHSVLWAALLPDAETDAAPDAVTLVNTFRIVFNEEFHAELPLLPNRLYHSTFEQPYRFMDVTDRLIATEAVGEEPDS